MFVQIIFSTDATVRTLHEVSYDTQEHDKTSPGLFFDLDVNIGFIESRLLSFRLVYHYLYFQHRSNNFALTDWRLIARSGRA